ncbi:GNAT family N-acetyltransferase [Alicyclobacillus sp. SO9]|nr:GNAT family N-acetyltransferase [Alicyclobacillus sp. SO9]
MTTNYSIDVSLEQREEFSAFLKQKIREYNNDHSIHHREARREGSVQPITIIVSDDDNRWIGGISAEVYWNWLEIHDFWLSEGCRGKGLGTLLLNKVETIAREKGATKVLLTTFEFQARTFYELHQYKVVGEIQDYPPGSTYYTMVKIFGEIGYPVQLLEAAIPQ